jgi:ABC-2 type transport system ATP-binding protein
MARNLSKRYHRHSERVLDQVDLAIPSGRIIALVGPNGAGKSTLIKTWIGFEKPSSGRVEVAGNDPFRDRAAVLLGVGYVPQTPSLYRDLTVADHLALCKQLRSTFDAAFARQRLNDLAIPLDALAGRLSGGQQAQVGLALALGTRARTLLLDEPLASLDPLARREFLFLVAEYVKAEGATALMSSHTIADIEQAADHLVVLGKGRVLLDEPVPAALRGHAVLANPSSAGSRAIVGSFLDVFGTPRILVKGESVAGSAVEQRATLEELVLGYLAAGRVGLADRRRSIASGGQ